MDTLELLDIIDALNESLSNLEGIDPSDTLGLMDAIDGVNENLVKLGGTAGESGLGLTLEAEQLLEQQTNEQMAIDAEHATKMLAELFGNKPQSNAKTSDFTYELDTVLEGWDDTDIEDSDILYDTTRGENADKHGFSPIFNNKTVAYIKALKTLNDIAMEYNYNILYGDFSHTAQSSLFDSMGVEGSYGIVAQLEYKSRIARAEVDEYGRIIILSGASGINSPHKKPLAYSSKKAIIANIEKALTGDNAFNSDTPQTPEDKNSQSAYSPDNPYAQYANDDADAKKNADDWEVRKPLTEDMLADFNQLAESQGYTTYAESRHAGLGVFQAEKEVGNLKVDISGQFKNHGGSSAYENARDFTMSLDVNGETEEYQYSNDLSLLLSKANEWLGSEPHNPKKGSDLSQILSDLQAGRLSPTDLDVAKIDSLISDKSEATESILGQIMDIVADNYADTNNKAVT